VAELLWDGKFQRTSRATAERVELPLTTVETVGESACAKRPSVSPVGWSRPREWRDRLIWGDTKYVLPSLRTEFGHQVDLIYIDPPFYTGADFTVAVAVPAAHESSKESSPCFEMTAYRDSWRPSPEEMSRGVAPLDKYLQWFTDTVAVLRELLSDRGLLFVHLDDNVGHEAKVVLDETFGADHFRGEIIWRLGTGAKSRKFFSIQHNIILVYSRGDAWTYNYDERIAREPFAEGSLGTHFRRVDEHGRRYRVRTIRGKDYKYYADEGRAVGSVWTDISSMTANSPIIAEGTGYPTQKPEKLLERIIGVCTRPNDLVLDCFCGSGTTPTVAAKLGRRWIACDVSRFAIQTTRKRLLANSPAAQFVVQTLAQYERRAWATAEFGTDRAAAEAAYRQFILELFRADRVEGWEWIHGSKAGRFVYVGAVDAPVTASDIAEIVADVARATGDVGGQAEILAWEFELESTEALRQVAARSRVAVRFRRIPRDVLESQAVVGGDIEERDFFELRSFTTRATLVGRELVVDLTDFVMPQMDAAEDARTGIRHFSQWIDYWAIDWDYRVGPFHNRWRSYRTRREPKLALSARHLYEETGSYAVVVQVIDIFGGETTGTIRVAVD
jgi:DNA modification methylase